MRFHLILYWRAVLWGTVAVVAAASTAIGLDRHLDALRAQIPAGGLVDVVVAGRDLEPGQVLDEASVRTARVPASGAPPRRLRDPGAALGAEVLVALDLGQVLTERTVGRGGPSSAVPAGMRAYDLVVDVPAGSAFAPRAGDRVDVIAVHADDLTGQAGAGTVLRQRTVVAVSAAGGDAGGRGFDDVALSGAPGRITLLVTPEEAERLAMAESFGRVRVVLAPAVPDGDDLAGGPDAPPGDPVVPGAAGTAAGG